MPAVVKSDLDALLALLRAHTPDLAADHDAIVEELKRIFLAGFSASAADVPVDTTMTEMASEWALSRAGELISDITDVTREGVAELVSSAVADGLSPGQLAVALRDYSGFDADRAETIAVTETANALGQGQRAAAVVMGQDEKQWIPGQCDYCLSNAGDGWIGIDETFSSGDDTVPGHPRCTCTVIYRTRRVHDDDDDDEEEKALRRIARRGPLVVAEAHCVTCHRWVGRNVNADATVYCPKCKETRIYG